MTDPTVPTPEEQEGIGFDEDGPCWPCPAEARCPRCHPYWQRMRDEGFWDDDEGWTEKATNLE